MAATRHDDLFDPQKSNAKAYVASMTEQSKAQIWHKRLAHLNTRDLETTWKSVQFPTIYLENYFS